MTARPDAVVHVTAPPRYLSVQAIAAHLCVSRMTVYRLLDSKELPSVRVGRLIRVRVDDFEQWVNAQRVTP